MPDREVQTIEHLIYYQYAKIIAKSALNVSDGKAAKGAHYGFIKNTFRQLKQREMKWSDITREDWQFVQKDKVCIYCGASKDLSQEHIVPRSISVNQRCPTCPRIREIHNQVWACRACNSAKGDSGLYEFYKRRLHPEPKYYDLIPKLLEKKYLKTIWHCHTCAGTLTSTDIDGDGEITVLDIDHIIHQ
ncbi:MAG: HNH endonuclease [Ignavibacteria bacterium]|nr:HNH endonuclease [Ignavibacteria bacterium]